VIPQEAVPPDSIRAVLDSVLAQPAYQWYQPRSPFAFVRDLWLALREWIGRLEQERPVAFMVLLTTATILLIAILTHFGYLIWRAWRSKPVEPGVGLASARPVRDEAYHLAQFRRLLDSGHYAEAMAERFTALVLALGRRAAVKPDHSKTPAEYVVEARLDPAGRSALAMLVDDLYRRLFGGEPSTLEDARRFDAAAAQLGGRVASP
jgi:hypothetical protein